MAEAVIDTVRDGVPAALTSICKLGKTMEHLAANVLAFFDRPGTSNDATEAVNGHLEHLRARIPQLHELTSPGRFSMPEDSDRSYAPIAMSPLHSVWSFRAEQCKPAVDRQRYSRDEGGLVRSEVQHGPGGIGGCTHAWQRLRAGEVELPLGR